MKITQGYIAEIRDKADIVELFSSYGVSLKTQGSRDNLMGRCPFHDDRVPSLNVSRSKKLFHCFGCEESGNVFGLVMKLENLTFPQAVEKLRRIVLTK